MEDVKEQFGVWTHLIGKSNYNMGVYDAMTKILNSNLPNKLEMADLLKTLIKEKR